MRGFLKNGSTLFQLSSKITTVGRECCDLIVQSASVDNQHATVEYLDEKEEFYLKDLKSRFGTKVNSYTLKDNIIKLARGDKIKFGKCDLIFEFVTDSLPEISTGVKSELPYLKKCQNLQHHYSNNNSLVRVPRPPSKPLQSNSLKRPINLSQNRDTKSKSLPRNCDIFTLEEKDVKFSENSRNNSCDNTQFMINLGKDIESIKESVNDSLFVNMEKMDLLHELNVLKKELHLKNEEILAFKKEMDLLRTSEMNRLTFRADEAAEIQNLRQTVDECQAFNSNLKAKLEALQRENRKKEELIHGLTEECEHFKSCELNLTERNVILIKENERLQLVTKDLKQQIQEFHEFNEEHQKFQKLYKNDKEDLEKMLSSEKMKMSEATNKIEDLLKKLDPRFEESVGNNITELICKFEQVITKIYGEKEQLSSELNIFLMLNEYWKELKSSEFTSKKLISVIEKLKNNNINSEAHGSVANTLEFLQALRTWQFFVETRLKSEGSFEIGEEILDHIDFMHMNIKHGKEDISALQNELETFRAKSELDLKSAQELAEQKLRTLSEENEQKILEITKGTASKEKALLLQIQSLEQTKSEMSLKISEIIESNQKEKQLLMQQMTEQEKELKKLMNDLQSKQAIVVDALNNDIEEFKEQVRQHSITICSQEEQILFFNQESKELKIEIERLNREIEKVQVENIQSNSLKIHSLERDLFELKSEIARYTILMQEKENTIDLLKAELQKLQIKLTDAAGELSEEHKKQLEDQLKEMTLSQNQLTDAHNQIEKIRKINAEMESRVLEMDDETGRLKRELSDYKRIIQKLEKEGAKQKSSLEYISQPTLNMSAQGNLCMQENHEETIKRQREALSKFRAKLKALEHGDMPLLCKDDAIQHVAFLRRELEELKSMRSDGSHLPANNQIHVIGKLTKLLEISENLYLSLLSNIAKSLDLDEIIGTKSLLHCPERNLQALVEEKNQSCRQLTNLICSLKEKLGKNELTWQDGALRSLESTNVELRKSVEKLSSDLIRKKEEIMCLRQTLRETTERLTEERSKHVYKSKFQMLKD